MLSQVGVDSIWELQLGCGSSLRGWGSVASWCVGWCLGGAVCVCGFACGLEHGRVDRGARDQAIMPLQLHEEFMIVEMIVEIKFHFTCGYIVSLYYFHDDTCFMILPNQTKSPN